MSGKRVLKGSKNMKSQDKKPKKDKKIPTNAKELSSDQLKPPKLTGGGSWAPGSLPE